MSLSDLALPDQLAGPWRNALFLSYGLDLPFFERALAPQLDPGCKNRVLLGDERTYLASCDHFARSGLVRHANARYIAEPILRRARSHAKVILLTSGEGGRLLVGSGNISLQGYGSGGEMFTRYNYGPDNAFDLAEFGSIRRLLERIRDEGRLSRSAAWHLDRLLETTPWLFRSETGLPSRVRHNLDRPLLEHFVEAAGVSPVEELYVLAPFFDEELRALTALVTRLQPRLTAVLVQPGRTSIDGHALAELRRTTDRSLDVCPVSRSHGPWLHAKLLLARGTDTAICLQGSANVSRAGLLLADPRCNLEVASLLKGARDAFDPLLDGLEIAPAVADVTQLDLRYRSDPQGDDGDQLDEAGWQLTGAEWTEGVLHFGYRGELPPLDGVGLLIADLLYSADVVALEPGSVTLEAKSADGPVTSGGPVRLRFRDGTASNAVFPCDRASLTATVEADLHDTGALERVGTLDLDDDELERLIHELDSILVIDRRSVWQLAGRAPSQGESEEDELRMDYADVDYEMLRAHPRIQQYTSAHSRPGAGGRSRLQIILDSITAAFDQIGADLPTDGSPAAALEAATTATFGRVDEADPDGEEPPSARHRWARGARLSLLFRRFIERFLEGLGSPGFREFAGPDLMARNYIVFFHILARIADREWIERPFIGGAIRRAVEGFWGPADSGGYLAGLSNPAEREQALDIVKEGHGDAQLLALLYQFALGTRLGQEVAVRREIRDGWRAALLGRFPATPPAVSAARAFLTALAPPDGPPRTGIAEELHLLAGYETQQELAELIAVRFGTEAAACQFRREVFARDGPKGQTHSLIVEDDAAVMTIEDARVALAAWLRVDEHLRHRLAVASKDGRRTRYVAVYEPASGRGLYSARERAEPLVSLTQIKPEPRPWDAQLSALIAAAGYADEEADRAAAGRQ